MKLIGYMLSAEKGEAAEFVAMRGFDYFHHDPEVAADIMQGMAAENSSSPKPFFHGHLRTDPNERLTDAQWMEAIGASFQSAPSLAIHGQSVSRLSPTSYCRCCWSLPSKRQRVAVVLALAATGALVFIAYRDMASAGRSMTSAALRPCAALQNFPSV